MTEAEYAVAFLAQLGIRRTEVTAEMMAAVARFRDHVLTEGTPKAELRWKSDVTPTTVKLILQQKWSAPSGDVWRDVPLTGDEAR